jgi:hypothetical protein
MSERVPFESLSHNTRPSRRGDVLGVQVAQTAGEWASLWAVLAPRPPAYREPAPTVDWDTSMVLVAAAGVADTSYDVAIRDVIRNGRQLRVRADVVMAREAGLCVVCVATHSVAIPKLDFDDAELAELSAG